VPSNNRIERAKQAAVAAELTVQERVLLFCLGSGTEWAQAGVTGATATAMLVRGLAERDASGRLALTPQGPRGAGCPVERTRPNLTRRLGSPAPIFRTSRKPLSPRHLQGNPAVRPLVLTLHLKSRITGE
jgi:hypothetical protein